MTTYENGVQRLTRHEIEKISFEFKRLDGLYPWWPREVHIQGIAAKFKLSILAVRSVVDSIPK